VVVKENHQRTILRIDLPAGGVFIKRSRANTPRAWMREILRPPKAQLEFENATRLRAMGIDCAEPLLWAETDSLWPGESTVVTREVAGSVPLQEYLRDSLSTVDRRTIARELGQLFARMHAVGVAHPDPHPGNFLVRRDDGPRLVLLDVHAVRFGPPLTWTETTANLVLLNRWFQLRANRADRARFWQAYLAERTRGADPLMIVSNTSGPRPAARLELATAASNRRFWATRDDRYLSTNRQFRKVKAKGIRGHVVRDLPDELVRAWLADPDAVFTRANVALLKDSPSATVVIADGFLFKRFRLKSRTDTVKNLFRRSEAVRSWVFGHALLDRHLPTARPLFVAERYRAGVPHEGYVVFELVPGAVELPEFVGSASFAQLRRLCETLGRLIRMLHDRGLSHRDLKAPNILLSGPERMPVFIDLVGLAVHTEVPAKLRQRDLARLNAGFVQSPYVSRTVRLRLLLAYFRAWPAMADDWKTWWHAISERTEAKVLKNLQNGRPLA
jgi:tRNA A-37 threonylcarbamoyl transferase component Bud32